MKRFRLVLRQSIRQIAVMAPPTFENEKAAQAYVDMLPQKEFEALVSCMQSPKSSRTPLYSESNRHYTVASGWYASIR